jgi:hypothetical protein
MTKKVNLGPDPRDPYTDPENPHPSSCIYETCITDRVAFHLPDIVANCIYEYGEYPNLGGSEKHE